MGTYLRDKSSAIAYNMSRFRRPTDVSPWTPVSTSIGSRKLLRTVSGVTLPDHESLILSGKSATTPLSGVFEDLTLSVPFLTAVQNDGQYYKSNDYNFPVGIAFPNFPQSVKDAAKAKCLKKFNNFVLERQSPLQAQIFLGELRETLAFIKHPLGQTIQTVESLKPAMLSLTKKSLTLRDALRTEPPGAKSKRARRLERELVNVTKQISKLHLEMNFAVLPLLGDIDKIFELVMIGKNEVMRSKFYGKHETINVTSSSVNVDNTVVKQITETYKAEYIIHCGLTIEDVTEYTGIADYLRSSTMEFSQLVPTAYELTYLSWLVDYFVNVGDIIQGVANSAKVGFSYTSASMVTTYTRHELVTNIIRGAAFKPGSLVAPLEAPSMTLRQRKVERDVLATIVPPVVFHVPGSDRKLMNLTALLLNKLL